MAVCVTDMLNLFWLGSQPMEKRRFLW